MSIPTPDHNVPRDNQQTEAAGTPQWVLDARLNASKHKFISGPIKPPEVRRAHTMVAVAVKNGTLIKPKVCSECGQSKRLHGHHEDYQKPLQVDWLCSTCHLKRHGLLVPRNDYLPHPKGTACKWARLTEQDVREIRAMGDPAKLNKRELARKYGVNESTIHLAIRGKTWKHLNS